MSLIKCPECGTQISDKADECPICGCPKIEWEKEKKIKCSYCGSDKIDKNGYCDICGMKSAERRDKENRTISTNEPYVICPKCGFHNKSNGFKCKKCGYHYKMNEYKVIYPKDENCEFHGVYRSTLFNGLQEVYCPRCGSENCSHYQEQVFMPGKTKTKYTANLNPFKPFTLVNKKEKVIRKDRTITESKFVCNKCGKIFY